MRRLLLITIPALLAPALLAGTPAMAQLLGPRATPPAKPEPKPEVASGAPVNGVLVIYGNQRCPTDANGNEVVVCQRRPAEEQYRIPKELRDFQITPQNQSWAVRAQGALDQQTGIGNGTGSCSAVGPGGFTGCFGQEFRAAKQDKQQQESDQQQQTRAQSQIAK